MAAAKTPKTTPKSAPKKPAATSADPAALRKTLETHIGNGAVDKAIATLFELIDAGGSLERIARFSNYSRMSVFDYAWSRRGTDLMRYAMANKVPVNKLPPYSSLKRDTGAAGRTLHPAAQCLLGAVASDRYSWPRVPDAAKKVAVCACLQLLPPAEDIETALNLIFEQARAAAQTPNGSAEAVKSLRFAQTCCAKLPASAEFKSKFSEKIKKAAEHVEKSKTDSKSLADWITACEHAVASDALEVFEFLAPKVKTLHPNFFNLRNPNSAHLLDIALSNGSYKCLRALAASGSRYPWGPGPDQNAFAKLRAFVTGNGRPAKLKSCPDLAETEDAIFRELKSDALLHHLEIGFEPAEAAKAVDALIDGALKNVKTSKSKSMFEALVLRNCSAEAAPEAPKKRKDAPRL